jgi:CysZ protein
LDVPEFIKENKLWRGFRDHRMVTVALLVVGAIFSWHLFGVVLDWWSHLEVHDPIEAGLQATFLVKDLAVSGYEFMFAGAYKYLVLIIMELLIFHMTLSTHAVLNGKRDPLTPGIFVKAQIRMVKVSIFTFAMELVTSILIKVVLSILGFDLIKGVLLFLTQCFFLGFAMIDNYNEIHHLEIKQSYKHTMKYAGVAVGIGIVLYVLIMIPVIGPFAGPMIAAIAATLVMHELEGPQLEEHLI